jgi:hypothetical protein
MSLTDVSEAAPILNECDLKLSNCMPAKIRTPNNSRVIDVHIVFFFKN